MKRRPILLAIAGASLAVAIVIPSAQAGHAWGGYHWARTSMTTPLTLDVGDNMTTSGWKDILTASNADWNASAVLENRIVAGRAGKNCKAVAGTVQVCNGTYGQNGWLGLAQIWLSGGHITQGVAKMNDTYFAMTRYNLYSERRHVLCQEVGHTFGLGHTSEDGTSQDTCMDYYKNLTDQETTSTRPNQHDFDQLAAIYNHADAPVSTGTKPGRGNAGGNGRDVFVDQMANGQTRVTFIYWADGHGGHHHHDH